MNEIIDTYYSFGLWDILIPALVLTVVYGILWFFSARSAKQLAQFFEATYDEQPSEYMTKISERDGFRLAAISLLFGILAFIGHEIWQTVQLEQRVVAHVSRNIALDDITVAERGLNDENIFTVVVRGVTKEDDPLHGEPVTAYIELQHHRDSGLMVPVEYWVPSLDEAPVREYSDLAEFLEKATIKESTLE